MANAILINSIDTFAQEVSKAIKERTEAEVTVSKVDKNNGLILTGITIKGASNMAPNIYLEKFFDSYSEGEMTFAEIVEEVIELANEAIPVTDFDISFFTNWESVKSRISMKLINYDANEEMLKQVPHMIFGDLAIIFQVVIDEIADGKGTIKITNSHLSLWNKTAEELYEAAMLNRDEAMIQTLFSVLCEMSGLSTEEAEMMGLNIGPEIYLLSNEDKINGSILLENHDVLESFAKEHGSFYVIPSSIHECLLFVEQEGMTEDDLSAMVQEVNCAEVRPDEVLSDHVYYYNSETNQLLMSVDGDEMRIIAA